jgi:hypothetical protein
METISVFQRIVFGIHRASTFRHTVRLEGTIVFRRYVLLLGMKLLPSFILPSKAGMYGIQARDGDDDNSALHHDDNASRTVRSLVLGGCIAG